MVRCESWVVFSLAAFLHFTFAFAQVPTHSVDNSIDEVCDTYSIDEPMTENVAVQCVENPEENDENPTNLKIKAYLGGLATSQTKNPLEPISYWNLVVEFPLVWKLQTNLSVDNPVLGSGLPSTIIQPARTSYHITLSVENIKIGNVDGIRVSLFHISDHIVDELISFDNNQFDDFYDGGYADIFSIQKKLFNDQTKVEAGYIGASSNYNIVRYFDIPGYLITEVGTKGFLVRADQSIKLDVAHSPSFLGQILKGTEVNLGGAYLWDIKGEEIPLPSVAGNANGTLRKYPDGDLVAGYADISKLFRIGDTTGKIHLIAAGQVPFENLDKITTYTLRNSNIEPHSASRTGYITLGFEVLPAFNAKFLKKP